MVGTSTLPSPRTSHGSLGHRDLGERAEHVSYVGVNLQAVLNEGWAGRGNRRTRRATAEDAISPATGAVSGVKVRSFSTDHSRPGDLIALNAFESTEVNTGFGRPRLTDNHLLDNFGAAPPGAGTVHLLKRSSRSAGCL